MDIKQLILYILTFLATVIIPFVLLLIILPLTGTPLATLGKTVYKGYSVLSIILGLFGMYWVFMFFYLQSVFLHTKPKENIPVQTQSVLIEQLQKISDLKDESGKPLFSTSYANNTFVITWSGNVTYNQAVQIGQISKKRVFVLTFDENKHTAFLIQKDKDTSWSADATGLGFSYSFQSGIYAESYKEYIPSIIIQDNNITLDVKKLSYNSSQIFFPVRDIILNNGWSIESGLIRNKALIALIICVVGITLFFTSNYAILNAVLQVKK